MKPSRAAALGMAGLGLALGLAACNRASAPAEPEFSLHHMMKQVVDVQAKRIWAVGNKAFDDVGKPDASLLDEQDWKQVAAASVELRKGALYLKSHPGLPVTVGDEKVQDAEDPHEAGRIAAWIKADQPGFTGAADALAGASDTFAKAAATRDVTLLDQAADGLDEVCESCHSRFWYPDDVKPRP